MPEESEDDPEQKASACVLTAYPGESFLAHNAKTWQEQARARLAAKHLLGVAEGLPPPANESIVDVDLTALPALPPDHHGYERRLEIRTSILAKNKANAKKRLRVTLDAWTALYVAVKTCTERTAPVLSKDIEDACDLSKRDPTLLGYYDGPLAWRMALNKMSDEQRSKDNGDFYRSAERIQRAASLPDGCKGDEYSKKALAFLVHINPFLAQSYTNDDVSQYLIELMPKALREGGRRIKNELIQEKKLQDHMAVIQKCRSLVVEEQKASAPTPAFVVVQDIDLCGTSLEQLQRTTGMHLSLDGYDHLNGQSHGGIAAAGVPGKWCDGCPHGKGANGLEKDCFQDPGWTGPPPMNIYLNKERWNGLLAARAANATKSGRTLATVKLPTQKEVDAYQKARKERREKAKAKQGAPGGVAVDGSGTFQAWRQSLVDIDDGDGVPAPGGVAIDSDALDELLSSTGNAQMMALDGDTGVEELDDDDDDDDHGPPQHWYVLMAVADAPPELHCYPDPSFLAYDADALTPVEFGSDEAGARAHYAALNARGTATPAPGAPKASRTQSRVDVSSLAAAARAVAPGAPSTGMAARTAVLGDPLGPTPIPGLDDVPVTAATPDDPRPKSTAMAYDSRPKTTLVVAETTKPASLAPTPLPVLRDEHESPPRSSITPKTGKCDECDGDDAGCDALYSPFKPTPRTRGSAAVRSARTEPASDAERHLARKALASTATAFGAVVCLIVFRLIGSLDFSLGTGLAAAAGHVYASEQGHYSAFTLAGAIGQARGALGAISRFVTEHFVMVCLVLVLVFFLRGAHGAVQGGVGYRRTMVAPSDAWHTPQISQIPHVQPFQAFAAGTPRAMVTLFPSPPPSPPIGPLRQPRDDYLTHEQAQQLRVELLAGCRVPDGVPKSITHSIAIGDTGCARSMMNHLDQAKPGSEYDQESSVDGASGAFKTKTCAHMAYPMDTNKGIRLWDEAGSIVNKACAYVLLALGKASRQSGASLWMPPWGEDSSFQYPNGVIVTLLNRDVLVLRPLGYTPQPQKSLKAAGAATATEPLISPERLGIPKSGPFVLYLGSGPRREHDLTDQCKSVQAGVAVVLIDILIDSTHDMTNGLLMRSLLTHVTERTRGLISSTRCKTWSVANVLPDSQGRPGKPWRDCDHLLGIPRDGKIPREVTDSNLESEHAATIASAVHSAGGFVMVEAPCRRTGHKALERHVLSDCTRTVHMFDHPAWSSFADNADATEHVWDQCKFAENPYETPVKSSVWLCTPNVSQHVEAVFGAPPDSLCSHRVGTHTALRGADKDGIYVTSSSNCENYSAGVNLGIANVVQRFMVSSAAAVMGVIQGKVLPKHAVTHEFLHDTFTHSEARVLKHLCDALSDAPEWWKHVIEDKPCPICLRANSSRLGPTGSLPRDDGLIYLDIHHVTVAELFTGRRTTVGSTHAKTTFCKSARVNGKGDAHEAIELMLAFYNSTGNAITWIHTDNAHELKGTKVVAMARSRNIRITTTTVDSSRKNLQEPTWRAQMNVTRTEIEGGKGNYTLWGKAWDHAEEGRNLKPSREAPFDCALGRLLTNGNKSGAVIKPPGSFRRPFLCLGYITDAPRLPSGTLVNKIAAQGRPALHLGYMGGRSGSFEEIGTDHTQSGYAMLVCGEGDSQPHIEVTSDVRFVPACRPGLARTSRGGWTIPEISLDGREVPRGVSPGDETVVNEIKEEADIPTAEQHQSFEMLRGFYEEPTPLPSGGGGTDAPGRGGGNDEPPGRGGTAETPVKPAPQPPTPYLVPREQWPDYPCDEHDGRGWEVNIIKKERQWALCEFTKAKDKDGRPFKAEWRRYADLTPLTMDDPASAPTQAEPSDPPTESAPQELTHSLVPDHNTVPAPGTDDPLREPTRPKRATHAPDRYTYSVGALAMHASEALETGFDLRSPRLAEAALFVNTQGGADRLASQATELTGIRGDTCMAATKHHPGDYLDLLQSEFNESVPELQRAAMIAADFADSNHEFGITAPQTVMLRELYATSVMAGALEGVQVPPLNPTVRIESGDRTGDEVPFDDIFDESLSGCLLTSEHPDHGGEVFALSKTRTAPDTYSERQMRGPEWDEPKSLEHAKIRRLEAKRDICADDPLIKGWQVCEMVWAGRVKRRPDGSVLKYNARCCARGDLDKGKLNISQNECTAPVARNTSMNAFDAVACLRGQHKCDYDVPGAYLQGEQKPHEQRVYRPPKEFRKWDERGVEILWLSLSPFYGQTDAGAIWNRTINESLTKEGPPDGCGVMRCSSDPSVYGINVDDGQLGGQVNGTLYVDDGRWAWDDGEPATDKLREIQKRQGDKFGITYGPDDPLDTHFLGANIHTAPSRRACTIKATSYIDQMIKRYADGDVSAPKYPTHWGYLPADDTLTRAFDHAMATRTPADPKLVTDYGSLYGSLLHTVKFRPEIAAALGKAGACLTFPTRELYDCLMHILVYLGRTRNIGANFSAFAPGGNKPVAYADSDWSITRSISGFLIMLAGAAICAVSRRQHCITMSSCEAELIALAEVAIELLHVLDVLDFMGLDVSEAVEVNTDSKAAYDLCHRFTSAQNSRHVDRKLFKMRELRGAGRVVVKHIPGVDNPADLFTKILSRQPFEKHRKTTLNLAADRGMDNTRKSQSGLWSASSPCDGTDVT